MPPGFQKKRRSKKSDMLYSSNIFFEQCSSAENQRPNTNWEVESKCENNSLKLPLHLLHKDGNDTERHRRRMVDSSYRTKTPSSTFRSQRSYNNRTLQKRAQEIVDEQTLDLKEAIRQKFRDRQLKEKTIGLLQQEIDRLKQQRGTKQQNDES